MNRPDPAFRAAADWLLEREVGRARDMGELAAAAEKACRRLEAVLRETIGDEGYAAILTRALHLAQDEHPYLARLTPGDDGECLRGLPEATAGQGLEEVRRGLTSLFAQTLQVLSSLITPEIVLGQIEWAWPDLPQPVVQAARKERER